MKTKPVNYILFILPTLMLFILVVRGPAGRAAGNLGHQLEDRRHAGFQRLSNYAELFTADRSFSQALVNNIVWIALQGTVHVAIGVLFGLILARRPFYWKFARTCYMIPSIISSAAMGMLFLCMFNAQFGFVNTLITLVSGKSCTQNWFMSYDTAFLTVTLTWLPYAGLTSLLVLYGNHLIDSGILERHVDGADSLQITCASSFRCSKTSSARRHPGNLRHAQKAGHHFADHQGRAGRHHHEPAHVHL
jgi:raffinose/stachyose/melibiose transport system permease protein